MNPSKIVDERGAWDSIVDTEFSDTIELFTELPLCPSCDNVILQFLEKYPNIKIKVIHNNRGKIPP